MFHGCTMVQHVNIGVVLCRVILKHYCVNEMTCWLNRTHKVHGEGWEEGVTSGTEREGEGESVHTQVFVYSVMAGTMCWKQIASPLFCIVRCPYPNTLWVVSILWSLFSTESEQGPTHSRPEQLCRWLHHGYCATCIIRTLMWFFMIDTCCSLERGCRNKANFFGGQIENFPK